MYSVSNRYFHPNIMKQNKTKSGRFKKINISKSEIYIEEVTPEIFKEVNRTSSEELYMVTIDKKVLRTPQGQPIVHENYNAIRELVAELEFSDVLDVHRISLYNLLCTQVDGIRSGISINKEDLFYALLNDPVLRTCAGPEVVEQMKYLNIIEEYLNEYNFDYPHLPQVQLEDRSWLSVDKKVEENFDKIVDHVYSLLSEFNEVQLTIFVTTYTVYSSTMLGVLLALKIISPQEFTVLYMTGICINSKVFSDVNRKQEKEMQLALKQNAECMVHYLELFNVRLTKIEELVIKGESLQLEFKSSLRWNIHTNCEDQKMEHSVLKSIVAFLNTEGGTLLVGVDDKGEAVGIDVDRFQNEDKYLLHFTNLINSRIGKQFCNYIKWQIEVYKGKKIMRVDCTPSSQPVFLKAGNQEQFFIRTGPATQELNSRELIDYTKSHFKTT